MTDPLADVAALSIAIVLVLGVGAPSPDTVISSVPPDCIEGGDGYLKVKLTGAHEFEVDWPNAGTTCHGGATQYGVGVNFGRTVAERSALTVGFTIHELAKGETGEGLPVAVSIGGDAVGNDLFTAPRTACTLDVTRHEPLDETSGVPAYRVAGHGQCEAPATAMVGDASISIGDFEFTGRTTWAN